MVLMCCYAYEGGYVIPGSKSILKISSPTDPIVTSIVTYINAKQKATAIQDDIDLWKPHNVADDLLQLLACETAMNTSE